MAPSPNGRDGRAQLIHEMSRELSQSRSRQNSHSPRSSKQDSPTKTTSEIHTLSSFSIDENEVLMSTRQLDDIPTIPIPDLRSSAARYAYYRPPEPEQRIDTSVVNREFGDFDQNGFEDEDSLSIELGRGFKGSLRDASNKENRSPGVNIANDSLYDAPSTPRRVRNTPRKTDGPERGSLRRDAQLRSAATVIRDTNIASGSPVSRTPEYRGTANARPAERARSTLAHMHARATSEDDENSTVDERPPTVTLNVKNTRFGNQRARQTHAAMETGPGINGSVHQLVDRAGRGTFTPQRVGGPQAGGSAPVTQQSFMLPDLPNLTELMSGSFKDGTPVFSRSTKARSRLVRGQGVPWPNHDPDHQPIESVPVPEDEKAIYASLQLLKERVAELENDKADSERKLDDYENDLAVMRAQLDAQEKQRSDSALGATDSEGRKLDWRAERTKLELTLTSLQTKLDRAERKQSLADVAVKRVTHERDSLASQLGVAYLNAEELKTEKEALQGENEILRKEVDSLRAENDDLHRANEDIRFQLARTEDIHQDDTQKWSKKDADLRRKLNQRENVVRVENETLRAELDQVRAERDEETQQWNRKETEIRTKAEKKTKWEQAKLRAENEGLKAQVSAAEANHKDNLRRWKSKEKDLRDRLNRRDDTISRFQQDHREVGDGPSQVENETLREKLAQLHAKHEDDTRKWTKKEQRLRERIQKREEAMRNMEEVTKDIFGAKDMAQFGASSQRDGAKDANTVKGQGVQRMSPLKAQAGRSVSAASGNPVKPFAGFPSSLLQSRRISAPQPSIQHVVDTSESEPESTTDLRPRKRKSSGTTGLETAQAVDDAQGDITYLSFMDVQEIAKLRKMLEEERIAARRNAQRQSADPNARSAGAPSQPALPRKSSMKSVKSALRELSPDELTSRTRATSGGFSEAEEVCLTSRDWANLSAAQRGNRSTMKQDETGRSMLSTTSTNRRRRSAPTEMTSAFILPDITVRVPAEAQDATNGFVDDDDKENQPCPHNARDCTVCGQEADTYNGANSKKRSTLAIPIPVPVSTRTAADDADVTMRPAQPPRQALATVLKELQDELAHLKRELAAQDALLQAQDASLGRRQRKAMQARMIKLLRAIDRRSDQIYKLYDVVEGQKDLSGAEMGENVVEETLRSVGIDPEELTTDLLGRGRKRKTVVVQSAEDTSESDMSSVDASPWEGISESKSGEVFDWRRGVIA